MYGELIRTIEKSNFRIRIVAEPEDVNPADIIDLPEPEAREYLAKIETGDYPWYCLAVYVDRKIPARGGYLLAPLTVGRAYLGCVDTVDLHAVGLRHVVADAVAHARHTLAALANADEDDTAA